MSVSSSSRDGAMARQMLKRQSASRLLQELLDTGQRQVVVSPSLAREISTPPFFFDLFSKFINEWTEAR